ncbi:hypothetical protein Scep_025248 [Stephania cephalantha]|uniref:AB hydrolase-1 domain-containing protein n=1 Tax=Stephania cephalantha TaxID=152367 RepID=A0AAP0HP43_9MAGN
MEESRKHFVLVHGACHGAWCWYKVKPVLERAGHQVTALDLAASGINSKNHLDVSTLSEYSEPLIKFLESLAEREKVILVGHSLGGMNIAFAAEKFPEKISTAVFLTAFMPDSSHQPSYVIEKYFEKTPMEEFMDSEFTFDEGEKVASSVFLGPKYLSSKLYQLSPMEPQLFGDTPRVVVITSGKGGVGKTAAAAAATNVGLSLARLGFSVVAIDVDIRLCNLDLLLGLEDRVNYTTVEVLNSDCRLDQALVRDKRWSRRRRRLWPRQWRQIEDEELALATMLVRVGPFMGKYLSNVANKFSEEKYGSVGRVYVVCKDDKIISESIQLWMTRNYTVKEVIEIEGADHMPMFSAPQDLCRALIHIARMHA